jgi:hypothetical protein
LSDLQSMVGTMSPAIVVTQQSVHNIAAGGLSALAGNVATL